MTTRIARIHDAIPIVKNTVERDLLYPFPDVDQRVQIVARGFIQRWNGTTWVDDIEMVPTPPDQVFNVRSYGAVGDGNQDDAPAIMKAVHAGNIGAVIWFPPGIYRLNSAILTPYEGQRWVGAGAKSTRLLKASTDAAIRVVQRNIKLDNFGIESAYYLDVSYGTNGYGVIFGGGDEDALVRDLVIENIDQSITFIGDAGLRLRCSDCVLTPYSGSGLAIWWFNDDTGPCYRQFVNIASPIGVLALGNAIGNTFVDASFRQITFGTTNQDNIFAGVRTLGGPTLTTTVQGIFLQVLGGKFSTNVVLSPQFNTGIFAANMNGTTFTDQSVVSPLILVPGYHRQEWRKATGATDFQTEADDGLVLGGTTGTCYLQNPAIRLRPLVLRNVASGTWTLDGNAIGTIEGAGTYALTAGSHVTLRPDPGAVSNWLIVG